MDSSKPGRASFNGRCPPFSLNEADDQGHGEGKTFLGRVTADSTGKWSLSLATGQVTAGHLVSATATTTSTPLETSEFGANVVVKS